MKKAITTFFLFSIIFAAAASARVLFDESEIQSAPPGFERLWEVNKVIYVLLGTPIIEIPMVDDQLVYSAEVYEKSFFDDEIMRRRVDYTYDAQSRMIRSIEQEEVAEGEWQEYEMIERTFEGDKLMEVLSKRFPGGVWEDYYKDTFDYNEGGSVSSRTFERNEEGAWNLDTKEDYTYEQISGGEQMTISAVVREDGQWKPNFEMIAKFNPEGNLYEIKNYNFEGLTKVGDYKYEISYSGGAPDMFVHYKFEEGLWQVKDRTTIEFLFSDPPQTNTVRENFVDEKWINYERTEQFYNFNGGITKIDLYLWNEEIEDWEISQQDVAEYEDGLPVSILSEEYLFQVWEPNSFFMSVFEDFFGNNFEFFGFRVELTYDELQDVHDFQTDESIIIKPNPAESVSTLEFEREFAGALRIDLLATDGAFVRSIHNGPAAAGAQSFHIDATDLPPGTYIVRIVDEKQVRFGKFVAVK